MEAVEVQPTNSKSVLGSMNDFVHGLKWRRDQFNSAEIDSLEDMLGQTPMGALNYQYPVEVAHDVFSNVGKRAATAPANKRLERTRQ